jgi:hypothetical protein
LNKINESQTGTEAAKEKEGEKEATAISLLKTLEDILRNRIKKKQEEVHKTKNIAENDRTYIEIETLHWVMSQSLSVRRRLAAHERYYY